MSFMITDDCISCDACVRVCPNGGISNDKKRATYVIASDSCTECVGFFSKPQCAAVCPMDCCVPDANNVQTEAVLFERAMATHGNSDNPPTLTVRTSRFQAAAAGTSQQIQPTAAGGGKWWGRLFGPVRDTA